jgi:WD40 repeat protein
MASIQEFPLAAFVVEAAFLGDTPAFALGSGMIRLVRGNVAEPARAHAGAILEAAATGDGRILSGGDDGFVALTGADGKVERIAQVERKWIDHVAVGPGGVLAYAAGKVATVRFPDGRERSFEHVRSVGGLAFAPKGVRLAVARYDGVDLRWAGTDAPPLELSWKGAHLGVTFSPDGNNVVTSMQENALHGWRLNDGKDMRMTGYPGKPKSLSWSVKGRYLASSGANVAILWPFHFKDGPMGRQPVQLGPREVQVTRVACHPREEIVAIGYQDGLVSSVRVADNKETRYRKPGNSPVSALVWDKTGDRLAFGCEDGAAGIVSMAG